MFTLTCSIIYNSCLWCINSASNMHTHFVVNRHKHFSAKSTLLFNQMQMQLFATRVKMLFFIHCLNFPLESSQFFLHLCIFYLWSNFPTILWISIRVCLSMDRVKRKNRNIYKKWNISSLFLPSHTQACNCLLFRDKNRETRAFPVLFSALIRIRFF